MLKHPLALLLAAILITSIAAFPPINAQSPQPQQQLESNGGLTAGFSLVSLASENTISNRWHLTIKLSDDMDGSYICDFSEKSRTILS
jgi:uncharacterized protein (UPF0333 family)